MKTLKNIIFILFYLLFLSFLSTPVNADIHISSFTPVADCYIVNEATGPHPGSSIYLNVELTTPTVKRSLLKFDISGLQDDYSILSSTLSLYGWASNDNLYFRLFRVTTGWSEYDVTWTTATPSTEWATPGGDVDTEVFISSGLVSSTSSWYEWDVTNLVRGWYYDNYPNNGFQIRYSTNNFILPALFVELSNR